MRRTNAAGWIKAKKITIDGYNFDSLTEGRFYTQYAKPMLIAGQIVNLVCDKKTLRFKLVVNDQLIGAYTPDFMFNRPGEIKKTVIEVKPTRGKISRDYVLRKKLFQALFPEYIFHEVRL